MKDSEIHRFEPEDIEIVGTALAPVQQTAIAAVNPLGSTPDEIINRATGVANNLKSALKQQGLISNIQGKEYPTCEAWTLAGTLLGVFPVCRWTKAIEGGFEARVEAVTMSGAVIGAAEAQCTRDERTWSNRDDFAIRSMAQTRATAKCLRMPLGFIMKLAGYEATPSEEMTFTPDQKQQLQQDVKEGQARHASKAETHAEAVMGGRPANAFPTPKAPQKQATGQQTASEDYADPNHPHYRLRFPCPKCGQVMLGRSKYVHNTIWPRAKGPVPHDVAAKLENHGFYCYAGDCNKKTSFPPYDKECIRLEAEAKGIDGAQPEPATPSDKGIVDDLEKELYNCGNLKELASQWETVQHNNQQGSLTEKGYKHLGKVKDEMKARHEAHNERAKEETDSIPF